MTEAQDKIDELIKMQLVGMLLKQLSHDFKIFLKLLLFRLLVSHFSEEQLDRFEYYKRSGFSRATMKKVSRKQFCY